MQQHGSAELPQVVRAMQDLSVKDATSANATKQQQWDVIPSNSLDQTSTEGAFGRLAQQPLFDTPASSVDGIAPEEAWRSLSCGLCSGWLASSLVLSCGHSFCGQCLYDWINGKPSCPACQVGLRAIPVRSLALDAAVGVFERLLPEGEQINLRHRVEDGRSAANKLNKMLWWLQPAAVPALGSQENGGSNGSTSGGGAPPQHRRSSGGGAPPPHLLARAHSATSSTALNLNVTTTVLPSGNSFTRSSSSSGAPPAPHRKSFPGNAPPPAVSNKPGSSNGGWQQPALPGSSSLPHAHSSQYPMARSSSQGGSFSAAASQQDTQSALQQLLLDSFIPQKSQGSFSLPPQHGGYGQLAMGGSGGCTSDSPNEGGGGANGNSSGSSYNQTASSSALGPAGLAAMQASLHQQAQKLHQAQVQLTAQAQAQQLHAAHAHAQLQQQTQQQQSLQQDHQAQLNQLLNSFYMQ